MVVRKPTAKKGEQKKAVSKADNPQKLILPNNQSLSLQLVDEDEEVQHVPEPQIEDDEYNLQRGVTRSFPVVKGNGKGIATDE
ncbi:hypothetical protein Tco_0161134 [Tanacetum coccineum]